MSDAFHFTVSKLTHAVAGTSILWGGCWTIFCHMARQHLFIHSSLEGHSDGPHLMALVNWVTNTFLEVPLWNFNQGRKESSVAYLNQSYILDLSWVNSWQFKTTLLMLTQHRNILDPNPIFHGH